MPSLTSIVVASASPSVTAGFTVHLYAVGYYDDGSHQDLTDTCTWLSSEPAVATIVSGGTATGVAPGETLITASVPLQSPTGSYPLSVVAASAGGTYGPYCQPGDVRDVLNPAGTTPPTGSPAALPDLILEDLIDDAQTEVNGYLATRYTVPFPAGHIPDLVAKLTRNVAAFYATLSAYGGQPLAATHPAQLRYTAAVSNLRALASGAMTLALPATDESTMAPTGQDVPGGASAINVYDGALFTPDDCGIVPDTNRPGGWATNPWPDGINDEGF